MPAYEFNCKSCGKDFTVFLSIKDFEKNPSIICEHCKSNNVTRKLSGFFAKTSKKS